MKVYVDPNSLRQKYYQAGSTVKDHFALSKLRVVEEDV